MIMAATLGINTSKDCLIYIKQSFEAKMHATGAQTHSEPLITGGAQ